MNHPTAPTLVAIAAQPVEAVPAVLGAQADGLSEAEAAARLTRYGPNSITKPAGRGVILRFLGLLASPLSLLLLALAVINYFTGQAAAAVVIGVMVILSSLLSFVQEYRSDRAAERLRQMVGTTVTVTRRDAAGAALERDVPMAAIVPGDIVHLSAGAIVPADVRILSCRDLFVSQAALTGESMPVEKTAQPATAESELDLNNIAFMGSHAVSGAARAIVVGTGERTRFGHLAAAIAGQRELTSFDHGVNAFIKLMLRVMACMLPLVFLLNGWSKGDWLEALLFAVAIAVGLAPELLPMIITVNLGKGALAMSGKHVIVKRLNAIQNLGAMDILCTDKTGTLTQDKVILEKHLDILGRDSDRVLDYAYLNSFHQTGLKNLLDLAILQYAHIHQRLGADTAYRKVDELPFDFERRRMSVIVQKEDGTRLLICKGAVEEIIAVCTHAELDGANMPMQEHHNDALLRVVQGLNEDGFRVIAVAYKQLAAGAAAAETELILLGYIAFIDPPKDSAHDAVNALHRYGVMVKVLTGDNDAVARHVCRHVGIATAPVVHGRDIDAMSDDELGRRSASASIFAKLKPEQKARVIRVLQAQGHVIGYLGDGINDGAALKGADVGISVDSGADIAKEAADIILLQKSLLALKDGVVEGRKVFGNISKYIKMSASSNFGNMISVLLASLVLPFLPMAPVQILLNNLLYDFSQTTVATDHVDSAYLQQPRRWDMGNVSHFMLFFGPLSALFDMITFAVLWFGLAAGAQPPLFQSGWFVESLLSQTLVVHVIRTGGNPLGRHHASTALLATTAAICMVGLWLPFSPFAAALGLVSPPPLFWLALPCIIVPYLLLAEALKRLLMRRIGLQ